MRLPTASGISETVNLEMVEHVKATTVLERENGVMAGGRHAHTTEEEATKTADEQPSKSSTADQSRDTKSVAKSSVLNSAFSRENHAEIHTPEDVCAGHGLVLHDLPLDASAVYAPGNGEKGHQCVAEGSDSCQGAAAAAARGARQETSVPERVTGKRSEEGAARRCDQRSGGAKGRSLKVRSQLQFERSKLKEHTDVECRRGGVNSCGVCATAVQETPVTCLPDGPRVHSCETEEGRATGTATGCRKVSTSYTPLNREVTAAVASDESKGCEGRESQEQCLRRVLCELDREALEGTQERVQRSVCFLLETRKEKEAEQLALLRERRRLDAMLADAQKQLAKYSNLSTTGEVVTASSLEEARILPNATSGLTCADTSMLSACSTRETFPAPQVQVVRRGRSGCEETVPVNNTCAANFLPLHPQPPLERGRNGTEPLRCLERQSQTYSGSVSDEAEEEGSENILADFLGDLLHKYGPAAVKGVGAAANIVKEGLGVLRQELRDLQQHQQATERQRALERHARYLLRREEELERLRHQHLLQQLQYQYVFAGGDRPPHLASPNVRAAAAAADSADARKVTMPMGSRTTVGAARRGHETQQQEVGKAISSQATTPARSTSCTALEEYTIPADGGQSPSVGQVSQREACIRPTGESRPADALVTKACQSQERFLYEESLQHMCEGSLPQEKQLQECANRELHPLNGSAEKRSGHGTSNLTSASDPVGRHDHVSDPDPKTDDVEISGEVCTDAFAKAAASSTWREFFTVEGKSSPPPHQFIEHDSEIEKRNSGAVAVMNSNIRTASNSLRCAEQGGRQQSGIPSSRCSVHGSSRPLRPVSSALPSPYRTLGTRKERLQRTAASLDSISRGVADAVGSVRHTLARWFYISEESSAASIEERVLTHENAISDAGDASCPSRVAGARQKKPCRLEPSALNIRGGEVQAGNTPTALLNSHAAADAAPVSERPAQENLQMDQGDLSISSCEKGDLPGGGTVAPEEPLNTIPESEATTRNSDVSSLMTQLADGDVADGDVTDGVLGMVGEAVSVTGDGTSCMRAVTDRYSSETARQTTSKAPDAEECDYKDGHAFVCKQASAANEGSRDEVRVASAPSSGGSHDHVSCTVGSVVRQPFRASTVTDRAEPAGHSNGLLPFDPIEGARDGLSVSIDGKEASLSRDSGSAYEEETADGRECSVDEDPPVIEASIRVSGKNGVIALPLVVLATEQCRDVAEEWVDRHWVQLQQTHFWLMRGKAAASEVGLTGISVSGNGLRGSGASGKRNSEVHVSELNGEEKGLAGRHASGSGAAKTTFLTRSRAIHSLAAFLGHAEATSENLPVRVVVDWEDVIISPSTETTQEIRQHTRQKNSVETCYMRK